MMRGTERKVIRGGIAVSPGVAVGRAYCVHEIFVGTEAEPLEDAEILTELARYDEAREKAAADLRALYQKVSKQVGEEEAAIFQVHESILHDPAFRAKIRQQIVDQRRTAQAALHHVLNEYIEIFTKTEDEYLKERLADVRDAIMRVNSHLREATESYSDAQPGPIILVANELVPSHVITLGKREVAGIITQAGGRTSHAAILARSRGIPAVSGAADILSQIANGDLVVVDGREGHVLINPDFDTENAYRKLQREFRDLQDKLAENRDQPAATRDGEPIELLANVNNVMDARAAVAMGGSGVGLYRTEYLFLTHPDVPDEEEQLQAYRELIAASPNRNATIRTLDLGGDKALPYLGRTRELNPFMGWRSIRLSFEHPEFFSTQVRAILRAAADEEADKRQVRMLFPMITTLDEMHRVQVIVRQACRQLAIDGKPFGQVPLGLMLEVPAAAVAIESFLEIVDFVSIGSNDLVQYLMAADRDNPKVNHLCEPLSPAVLRVLSRVIRACNQAKKHVTLCGEMAGVPGAFVLLVGMGLRSFSVSPAFIPMIKELAGHLTRGQAEETLARALKMKTANEIIHFVGKRLNEICPDACKMGSA
ncbi:MAG: phosphoenolpyruvate--protein phosphotransferase [Pirellulales bacterium]